MFERRARMIVMSCFIRLKFLFKFVTVIWKRRDTLKLTEEQWSINIVKLWQKGT